MSLNQLRDQRTSLAKEVRNLLEQNPGAKWKANARNQRDYDTKTSQIESLDAEIIRMQAAANLDADRAFNDAAGQVNAHNTRGNGRTAAPAGPLSPRGMYASWLRGGAEGFSAEQATAFRNTMSTTSTSQGGYTVETDVAAQIIDILKAFGGMRQVAEVFRTAQGNPLNYPTSDGTSEVGELVAQNAGAASVDPSFGVVGLGACKFSSKIITVPIELVADASVDIEGFVNRRCATRIGRIQNTKFTVGAGSGSGEPQGVVGAASLGKTGTAGQTGTMIFADIIDTEHSVDPAYRALGNCRWMMNDGSLKVIRKIVDGNGRPLFVPSYDTSITKGAPAELSGYPIQINQDVAAMAANAKSVLFGDFSFYKIRDVMEATMFRFTDSVYMSKGQIGFLMWARSDGNLVDTTAVRYYANSAS